MNKWILWSLLFSQYAFASSHHPIKWLESLKGRTDASQHIYQAYCQNCHAPKPLIPVGAPRVGVTQDWQGRKDLLKSTLLGKGLMPARGGCFECSDETLKDVVDYMLTYKDLKQSKRH